jgi:hypothetical protein
MEKAPAGCWELSPGLEVWTIALADGQPS